jgi:hypothetical protein
VGPDIEGPHEGLIVAPVEMTEDMSEMPNEVPIREEPIEVPLQCLTSAPTEQIEGFA